jgi:hypothetical protein
MLHFLAIKAIRLKTNVLVSVIALSFSQQQSHEKK